MPDKRDYHWTFGNSCRIWFQNGGDPVNTGPQSFSTDEGCASISDTNGNLLFYTDGRKLYNASGATVTGPGLGGNIKSACSALIVPPAGSGKLYHLFTVGQWDAPSNANKVNWTPIALSPVAMATFPAQLPFGPVKAAEKLAAVSHADCASYWVVSLGIDLKIGTFFAIRISGDAGPSAGATFTSPYPSGWVPYKEACVKFSPDGKLLAVTSAKTIDIFDFDRTTGLLTGHSQITGFQPPLHDAYGVEFSPDGRFLYYTSSNSGTVRRHTIVPTGGTMGSDAVVGSVSAVSQPKIGALQLGPNGKIYGSIFNSGNLLEIGYPNQNSATSVGFLTAALAADGKVLNLNAAARLGLPGFTRIPNDCDDRCSRIADQVGSQLSSHAEGLHNQMAPCREGEHDTGNPHEPGGAYGSEAPHGPPACTPLDLPDIRPWTSIRWGDSKCDCIEGDDTEIMSLTVCNPYSNLTLSNLTIHQLEVVDATGNPVPKLPDGSPSIQLVPIGPYCFDDIAPCTCITREFMLRLRGAPGARYEIKLKGICFDACFHGDTEACFTFDVCKD